ncbi:MAG: PKD domain-containing protein [Candidatus Lambdaproteobacteria bacterium]|nr:PKD domain-containing protein [Candidatus Lambdaproteobacteria bacterium]
MAPRPAGFGGGCGVGGLGVLIAACGGGSSGGSGGGAGGGTTTPLSAAITSPTGSQNITFNTAVTFTGSASGGTPPYVYAWNFDSTSVGGGPGSSSQQNPGSVTFALAGAYVVGLTVTDSTGAVASATVAITADPTLSTIGPLYSGTADWNQYVAADGTTALAATGAACDPATAGTGYDKCIHGGELQAVTVSGFSGCTGVFADDALGAFDWDCTASGDTVKFVSTGLNKGKFLSDLLDFTGTPAWRTNTVTVSGKGASATIPPAPSAILTLSLTPRLAPPPSQPLVPTVGGAGLGPATYGL